MPKSKKKKKGPSKQSSSSGTDKKEEEVYNVGILEDDLVNEYRTRFNSTNFDGTMIAMYRLNCKKRKNSRGPYKGRVDFRVGEGGSWHVLSRNTFDNSTARAYKLNGGRYTVENELLHLCDNERVSTPHCKIQGPGYPDDFIWIEDLKSEHGTFINGKKIGNGEKCRVFYGDVIGLGAPYDTQDQWGKPKDNKRGFVFTMKNFKICDSVSEELSTEAEQTPTFLALNNVVILDTIMQFLEMEDLKPARLVNRFWKNRVDPRLRGSIVMSFYHGYGYTKEDWDANFQGKVSMIREYGLGNWELEINQIRMKEDRRRIYTDVQWLVEHLGHHARNLELTSDDWPNPFGSNFPNVMSHFRNLEKLTISFVPPPDYSFPPTTFLSVTELNVSIKLKLDNHLDYDGGFMQHLRYQQLLRVSPFAPMFPNIRKFEGSGHQFYLMVKYIHENPQVWPNLEELVGTGGCGCRGCRDKLEDQKTIKMISTLPHKLTKIKYTSVTFSKDFGYNLELMMNNHSETLDHLHLSFEVYRKREQDRDILRFPSFPRLKVLELFLEGASTPRLEPEIMFPSGGSVCYEKDLPEIQKLKVTTSHGLYFGKGIMEEMIEVFLPKDTETVSRTSRWVDFGILQKHYVKDEDPDVKIDNPWYNEFLKRFVKVFPHVRDPHIIKGRKLLNIQD